MTPLRLELEGFTCFRAPTAIDLSELSVDLFAIAGPTGAGKSTLLDAMTYALYGQTARLGSRGLDALLSPGAERLTVQLAFRTAEGTFRVTRFAWQRASRVERQTRIERLDASGSWRQLPESEKLSEANDKLAEIVGLDYEGFTRAVLLPQGAFDEFLRGDAGKRRRLLTVLLGLDRVQAMQQLAGRYTREAEAKLQALRRRLDEDFAGATPERRRELSDERAAAESERAAASSEVERLTAALADADALRQLDEGLRGAERARTEIAAEEGRITEERRTLERADRAERVAPLVERTLQLEGRRRAADAQRVDLERGLADADAALTRDRQAAEAAERRVRERGAEIGERLERLAAVSSLAERLARAGGAPAPLEPSERAPFDEAAWERNAALTQQLPALERLEARRSSVRASLARLEAEVADSDRSVASQEGALEALVGEGREAAALYETLAEELATVERDNRVAALVVDLAVGDPCPVCGEPIRSLADHGAVDVAAVRSKLEAAERKREALRQRFIEAREALQVGRTSVEERRKQLVAGRSDASQLDADVEGLRRPFAEAGLPAEPGAALRAQRAELVADLAAAVHRATGGEQPGALRSRLVAERERLASDQRGAQQALAATERRREGMLSTLAEVRCRLEESNADALAARSELERALGEAGFATPEEASSARLLVTERAELERRLATFAERRADVERRLADLRARLGDRRYDADGHASLRQQRAVGDERLGAAQRRLGGLTSELARLETMLERARDLRAEMQGEEANYDTYRRLSLDLRSDQFQDFLMTRVQRDLARRASHIVRDVTEGRYDLRLADGEYQVLDGWSGGEARSAKTLSGGETFIASLALALALSDTVAGSHALGALFLDEGFGSLDGDTLDAVAGVLEALTSEGRMVGIITHVAALSERMPARLLVSKGPDGSSVRWDL